MFTILLCPKWCFYIVNVIMMQMQKIQVYKLKILFFVSSELSGQLIERVATQFNKLQFFVNKSRGLPLVEDIKPVCDASISNTPH